jgi:hypothetical protein
VPPACPKIGSCRLKLLPIRKLVWLKNVESFGTELETKSVGSGVQLSEGTISGNLGDGMTLRASTSVAFFGQTITGNGGNGVHLEDGAFAGFVAANVTGNLSGLDVACEPQFPITRFVDRTGGVTNCVEPASNSQRKPWNKITQPGTTSAARCFGRLLFLAMSPLGISLVTKISRQRSITHRLYGEQRRNLYSPAWLGAQMSERAIG